MVNVNFKDRKRSELVFEAGDSSNVTLVCGDGSLTFPSYRMLGICSPVVRSSNKREGEEVVIILPDFIKSTVSTVLEVVKMKWNGEKAISASEKDLLAGLGITTGALRPMKRCGEKGQKDFKQDVKLEPGERRGDMGNVKVKGKSASFKNEKGPQSKSDSQKERDIIKTKLEKTHSEINLAIVSSKAKHIIDYFMCDLCDEKVPKSDLKTHLNKEHEEDIGVPSDSEIQSYFRPSPTVDSTSTPPDAAFVAEAENLESTSEREKRSSPSTIQPEDETLPSKIAEMYGLNPTGCSLSIIPRAEKWSIQKEQGGSQNKKQSIQNKQPPKNTAPLRTAVPLIGQSEKIRVVPKVKILSKTQGVNLSNTISKPAVPPQLTKKIPSTSLPVTKLIDKPQSSEPIKNKSVELTKMQPVSDQDQTNEDMQKNVSTSIVEGSKDMLVKCPQCDVKFGGNSSTIKFELRSHIGLTHYKNELIIEVGKIFVENKCTHCNKMLKTKEQQKIHLLYKHTRCAQLISLEADKTMENRAGAGTPRDKNKKSEGIKLVPTSKLLSPQAKRAKVEEETKHKSAEIKREMKVENVEEEKVKKLESGKCTRCEKEFSGNDPDEISIHFLISHTATNDSYFLASNQCFVCDVAVLPENQNLHMMKMHDYMKSEIQSFILQVVKNTSKPNIGIKDELIKSEATSKVDALFESPASGRKAVDSIADIQRKLLAIVGTQAVQDIDEDPDFEEVVDDEEDAADDILANDLGDKTDEGDVLGVQAELIKMRNISIKMQNISDDDEEEDDRMEDFEDTLEDVLNFKEEEVDRELEEVYKDISDDEYCGENGEDNEIEREISLMREDGKTDVSDLEELV